MGKLSRLELFNFKSYKGHQSIEFGDSYFTSIIGPNGSGKSNSMDAISFVLGIKSSQLRSSHLRDLVYRGRVLKHSKVDGAVNGGEADEDEDEDAGADASASQSDPKTAWVMAVYENDDGEEQKWKRSINASGSSEYRINGKQCTAQDYNDALEKENILIKARNFLVFQGDVEAVASQSPKDLTKLIEQISGSLEYKAEYEQLKIEQEKAAETSNSNLHRRRGINAEIKQYQEQKREAENFEKKTDERDQAVVTHVLWKLFHFQRTIDENKAKIVQQQAEMREYKRSHEAEDAKYDKARKEHAVSIRAVQKQDRAIKTKEKEVEEKETSLVPIDEKIKIISKNVDTYTRRIVEISRDQESQSNEVKKLEKDLKDVEKMSTRFENEQAKLAKETGAALSAKDQADYDQLREQVNTRSAAENIKIESLTRQQKTDNESANSFRSKVNSTTRALTLAENELVDLNERFGQMDEQVNSITSETNLKKKELKKATDERLAIQGKKNALNEKLRETLQKIMEIEDGRRQNDREIRTRETLQTLKRIFPGVRGRVSELCKPKLKKYGDAVSTVLGRHFDAVVVDTEKMAKDCIEYLKDNRCGQMTFIPLDTIQVQPINSELKGMHRGMRMAIDSVEFDKSLERAMQYACGNDVICDDIQVAKFITFEKEKDVKAVTLDGTVIHKGGMMSGGRVDKRQAKRWEDNEAEGFHRMKDSLMTELGAFPDPAAQRAKEETLEAELGRLQTRLAYASDERKSLKRNLDDKKKEAQHHKQILATAQPQLDEAEQVVAELSQQLEELRAAVSEVEDEVFAAFCKRLKFENIRWYEERQGSLQAAASEKRKEYSLQKTRYESRLQGETGRLNDTTKRIEKLQAQLDRAEETIREQEEQKQIISDELDKLRGDLDDLVNKLAGKQKEVDTHSEAVAVLKREVSKRNKELENAAKIISQLEGDIERTSTNKYALLRRCKLEEIDVPLAEDSNDLDALPLEAIDEDEEDPDRMDVDEDPSTAGVKETNDYGIILDFDQLDDDLKDTGDEKAEGELLEKIKSIDRELEKMTPNMKAIERLEGVENRMKDTEKEFEDSRKQAKTARDKFLAVKQVRTDKFNKAFTHIADQIGKVYKDLTKSNIFPTGGTAYLDVEDSDVPYLDGIKYHAMPPMKRFRDMEHLSGGEKTMAALALLFAVHSYQASPFFVLDEVDAALDNANVSKIANYIRENSGPGFQFIVISLKTGLFQQSEALVGIYRDQVENSSKSLTLDLRKYVDTQVRE